jgi:hypothetical protein
MVEEHKYGISINNQRPSGPDITINHGTLPTTVEAQP